MLSLAKPNRWLRWNLISLVIRATFLTIAALYGPIYVAAAYSISYYVLLAPALWYAGRPVGLKVIPLQKALLPYFSAGLVTCFIWLAFTEFFSAINSFIIELSPAFRIAIVFSYSGVIYTALVVAFHRSFNPIKDIFSFVRTFLWRDRTNMSKTSRN